MVKKLTLRKVNLPQLPCCGTCISCVYPKSQRNQYLNELKLAITVHKHTCPKSRCSGKSLRALLLSYKHITCVLDQLALPKMECVPQLEPS